MPTDSPSGLALMVTAYALIWLVLFGYLWTIGRRQRALEQELRELGGEVRERVAEAEAEAGAPEK